MAEAAAPIFSAPRCARRAAGRIERIAKHEHADKNEDGQDDEPEQAEEGGFRDDAGDELPPLKPTGGQ